MILKFLYKNWRTNSTDCVSRSIMPQITLTWTPSHFRHHLNFFNSPSSVFQNDVNFSKNFIDYSRRKTIRARFIINWRIISFETGKPLKRLSFPNNIILVSRFNISIVSVPAFLSRAKLYSHTLSIKISHCNNYEHTKQLSHESSEKKFLATTFGLLCSMNCTLYARNSRTRCYKTSSHHISSVSFGHPSYN